MKWNDLLKNAKTVTGNSSNADAEDKLYTAFTELLTRTVTSDEEKEARIKSLRMRGFQIATSMGTDYEETFGHERSKLIKEAYLKRYGWAAYYTSAVAKLSERRLILETELTEIKARELKYDQVIDERKTVYKELSDAIEDLKQQAIKVRQSLAEARNKSGEQIITDAECELEKITALQHRMNESSKKLYEDRFARNKEVYDGLIKKWTALRAVREQHLLFISRQIDTLNAYGINPRVAYLLLAIGYAMAAVAGYFFAVFCSESNYSSNDAFYYLLKNIISTIAEHHTYIWLKFTCFVGLLALITGLAAFVDRQIIKENRRKKPEKAQVQSQRLATGLTLSGLKYAFKTKEQRLYLLWLSVMPLALIVGTIVLLLSYGKKIGSETDKLSASTEGLLIGTTMAIGLAAAVYIYIIKIVETRPGTDGLIGHLKRNRELALTIVVFICAVAAFAFYRHGYVVSYSIIGFIASCLVTAFAFSYGLRFLSYLELFRDTNNQIGYIDEAIANYSLPVQLDLSVGVDDYFRELGQGMLNNLRRKNGAFLETGNGQPTSAIIVSPGDPDEPGTAKFFHIFGRRTDRSTDEPFFKVSEWELTYFPEYSEQLRSLASLYEEKKSALASAKDELNKSITDKENKLRADEQNYKKIRDKVYQVQELELRISKMDLAQEINLMHEHDEEIGYLRDGFSLGIWLRLKQSFLFSFPLLLK